MKTTFSLFVCLFAWGFSCHSMNYVLIWRRRHYGGGLQVLTYARHLWPLSSEDYLACHTFFETGQPFIMVISETRDTHTYCLEFVSAAVTICFYDLGLSRLGFELPTLRLRGERSTAAARPLEKHVI